MESRTSVMMKYLESNFWPVSQDKEYLTLDGKKYRLLNRNIHDFRNECIASVGSKDREILLLDPASPLLRLTYHLLATTIDNSDTIWSVLKKAMIFVRKIFSDNHIENIKDIAKKNSLFFCKGHQVIFLDAFIENGAGLCRHHSLLLCYLIDCLAQEKFLNECTVTHHRETIMINEQLTGHAWVVVQVLQRPSKIYHLDSLWFDKPHFLPDDIENDPILRRYGSDIGKKYKIRYPISLRSQIDHKKLTSGRFSVHSNGFFSCELTTDDNLKFVYQQDKTLGKGSFGEVWEMSPSWAPPIVVKSFFLNRAYPATSTKAEIADSIKNYINTAKHEAEYNKLVSGFGQYYEFNSKVSVNTKLKTNLDGDQYQELLQPLPSVYIVIKKENGATAFNYKAQSAEHFISFFIAAVQALKKIHDKNIVHCDIHAENVLVEEKSSSDIVVNYIDMTLSGYEESDLFVSKNLNFNIKPPEYISIPSIKRKKNQDIYCLGLLCKSKYNKNYFSTELQSMIEGIFSEMMAEIPGDRLNCRRILVKLKKIQPLVFNCLTALEKLKISNPSFLAKFTESNVERLMSLWSGNVQLKLDALYFLFESKLALIKSSPNNHSNENMDRHFYCEYVLNEMFDDRNNNASSTVYEIIVIYNKLQSPSFRPGLGVKLYLESIVSSDSFQSSLEKFNEREQLYLLKNLDAQRLQNLVCAKNVLKVIDVTSLSALIFEKLNEKYIVKMVLEIAESNLLGLKKLFNCLPDGKRSRIIDALVKHKIAQSTFKKAVKFFDVLSEDSSLYKEILLSFSALYYIECSEFKNTRLSFKFFRHSQKEKLSASDALASGKMTPEDWKSHEGVLSHGGLGEVAKRLRMLG